MARYRIYLSDVSYFSGKLEAAFRIKGIDYERVPVSAETLRLEVMPNTGWMKVPAVRRDDGLWLYDTTPLIRWLDAEHPGRPLLPSDPATAFIAALIEDYCDEWQWRSAMFWRWAWPENASVLGRQLGKELSRDTLYPAFLMGIYFRRRQQLIYLRRDGVRANNRDAIAALYPQTLGWLETLLSTRPFLLGNRPSVVDVAWFGPMYRHFAQDPVPASRMQAEAPAVWAWVHRMWSAGEQPFPDAPLEDFGDPGWDPILAQIGADYLPYLQDNARAVASRARTFDGCYGGIEYPNLPAVRYRAQCLATLCADYAALDSAVRARVDARLASFSIPSRLADTTLTQGLPKIDSPIVQAPKPPSRLQSWSLRLTGTPWDRPGDSL